MTDRELLQQSLNELEHYETIFEERNINKIIIAIKARLAQPEPEELGEIIPADEEQLKRIANLVKPEKEWVGLTDKEVVMLAYQSQENECTAIRLAEQALKEKNT